MNEISVYRKKSTKIESHTTNRTILCELRLLYDRFSKFGVFFCVCLCHWIFIKAYWIECWVCKYLAIGLATFESGKGFSPSSISNICRSLYYIILNRQLPCLLCNNSYNITHMLTDTCLIRRTNDILSSEFQSMFNPKMCSDKAYRDVEPISFKPLNERNFKIENGISILNIWTYI